MEFRCFPASSFSMEDQQSSEHQPQQLRELIIRRALDAFLHGGYSRTSTDKISRMLGISKKTLYKVFPTKEELLRSVVRLATRSLEERANAVYADSATSVEKRLETLVTEISPIYARIRSPQMLLDFQRAAPTVWNELRLWRLERYAALHGLIAEGVSRGEVRADLSVDDVVTMYAILVDKCMDYETLEESSVSSLQLYQGLMDILLRGISVVHAGHRMPSVVPLVLERSPLMQASLTLFNTVGYSKTSSDEIARALAISKRTLYEQVCKKSHIATTLLLQTARAIDQRCDPLTFEDPATFILDLHLLITTYVGALRELSPVFIDDLATALPRLHRAFTVWRRSSFEYHISRAAAEGRRLGLLRTSIGAPVLIALVRLTMEDVLLRQPATNATGASVTVDDVVFTILYDGILQQRGQSQPQQKR